jgi:hypothetical protein
MTAGIETDDPQRTLAAQAEAGRRSVKGVCLMGTGTRVPGPRHSLEIPCAKTVLRPRLRKPKKNVSGTR